MHTEGILLFRTAISYMGMHEDDGRAAGVGLCLFYRRSHIVDIIAIFYNSRVPSISSKAACYVFREGQVGTAGERDMVLIVQVDQFAQAQVPCKRSRFLRDPFHQIAVAA